MYTPAERSQLYSTHNGDKSADTLELMYFSIWLTTNRKTHKKIVVPLYS